MTPLSVIILLVTGVVVGFASSLLGIGGGFIMTPVQYLVYTSMGIPDDTAIKLAFGTNLLVILPTALVGSWHHGKRGMVIWRAALIMGLCSTVAAFAGATLAARLPGAGLKTAFGALVLLSGIRLLVARVPDTQPEPETRAWIFVLAAIPIGLVTGLLGIGGGVLMIPLMVVWLKFSMHNAVGTSLAVMIFVSTAGVIGYIVNGLGASGLPPYSIGYVNLVSWFLLTVASVGMTRVGTAVAHKMPARQLRYIFVALTIYIGLKMVGVFDWLGWPL